MKQSSKDMHQQAYERMKEYKQTVASDPYRLHYHVMPPVGLLNDPNGFVYYKNQYHLFYQWNPFAAEHGAKFWGHYISDDLVHWKVAPIALAPDEWYDKNGCYSGSAVVHEDKMYVFYTGNVKDTDGNRESYQCLAISEDGIHFEKKGPVIHVPDGYTAHFRDPKVFCENNHWYMVLGAQTEAETGEAVMYTSLDLENWSFQGTLAGSGHHGLGDFGYMWECPDLFSLDGKDILLVCPQGLDPEGFKYQNVFQSGYFAGKFDDDSGAFQHGEFVELDRGFDFYAPQTTEDAKGRRLLFGWMGNAEEDGATQPTVKHEWIHAMTLPRELEWKDGRLLQHPVEELRKLREDEVKHEDVVVVGQDVKLEGVAGNVFELELKVKEWNAAWLNLQIGDSRIQYDQSSETFTFERRSFSEERSLESRHCVLKELTSVRIFKDTSSVEIFINGGKEVFSSRVFDGADANEVAFSADRDGKVVLDVRKWNVKRVTDY
ncbi:glycoside hydrolase family 32 protein [Oceanobacillus salinisoli]|uniref:glycoside hydrolase family 32 protein n=1 Tax=Oceanobacillus salinisoli TaxID=2678611 RepID=UPI0012E17E6A|nr:sucrose-6-phosphate hydrolase [Oceanobacillus salinisoli]